MDNSILIVSGLCAIIVGSIFILCSLISNYKYKRFLNSIKPGDVFTYKSRVNSYHWRVEDYLKELRSPFKQEALLVYPEGTCVITDIKTNEHGETWFAYKTIGSLRDFNDPTKYVHYDEIHEFLDYRSRVGTYDKDIQMLASKI